MAFGRKKTELMTEREAPEDDLNPAEDSSWRRVASHVQLRHKSPPGDATSAPRRISVRFVKGRNKLKLTRRGEAEWQQRNGEEKTRKLSAFTAKPSPLSTKTLQGRE